MISQAILGLICFSGIAWLFSENRWAISFSTLGIGLLLQFVLALLMLKLPPFQAFFLLLNQAIMALETATHAGTSFVFGFLGGGELPFQETHPGASFVLAFRALPLVLVISALSSLLFYWRVLPLVVHGFAWFLQRTMRIGGALGLATAANVFVGMIEAPLLIRPYLARLTRAELFAVMTCGMATIAGTVMVLYASFLSTVLPDALGHILTASLISAPAALVMAHLLVPETESSTSGELAIPQEATSSMEAITQGTLAGLQLLANIVAMLLVFVALVSLVNQLLGLLPALSGEPISLQRLLGWVMAPVAWLMGIPWQEAATAGQLLGIKTVLNELLAYLSLAKLPESALSESSRLILVYALCGFANFGSLGIMLGGLTAMAPERRAEIVELGLKSILAGTLATCMTGAVVGLVIN
ncbi:MAG: nucleoside transporter C-terminal domain-containing protein, partial [Candidatus Competibacteraceae bacterium]|nr:nucleoside transporter C-terminal domain-containing protein [Candidatus Competibacteraceae bacterium]